MPCPREECENRSSVSGLEEQAVRQAKFNPGYDGSELGLPVCC